MHPQASDIMLVCLQYGSLYATGQFPALLQTGLPLEGLQFALLMYAFLSVIFIGLSVRMNFALTALFTCIAAAYFCLGIGQTRSERVIKVRKAKSTPTAICSIRTV